MISTSDARHRPERAHKSKQQHVICLLFMMPSARPALRCDRCGTLSPMPTNLSYQRDADRRAKYHHTRQQGQPCTIGHGQGSIMNVGNIGVPPVSSTQIRRQSTMIFYLSACHECGGQPAQLHMNRPRSPDTGAGLGLGLLRSRSSCAAV